MECWEQYQTMLGNYKKFVDNENKFGALLTNFLEDLTVLIINFWLLRFSGTEVHPQVLIQLIDTWQTEL